MPRVMNDTDAVSAKDGVLYITIDGKVIELAELFNFEAIITYTKADVKSVNKRMKGDKIVGAEGTGALGMFYHRPENRRMALEYIRSGKQPVFDAQLINADITSRAGKQSTLVKGIKPNSAVLARLNGENDELLKEEFDFTFSDFDFLQQFNEIND